MQHPTSPGADPLSITELPNRRTLEPLLLTDPLGRQVRYQYDGSNL